VLSVSLVYYAHYTMLNFLLKFKRCKNFSIY